MTTFEITLIALDIRKWDLETQKISLVSYYIIKDSEESNQFEVTIMQPAEMVEECLGKLRYACEQKLRGEMEDIQLEVGFDNETFLRQKLYNYFKRITMELNNPRRKKGQPKMIFTTHMDVYNENQDISFLPRSTQFYVVLNWVRKYYDNEDFQRAIDPLRKLIKLRPDFGLGYKWLARSLKKVRKYEEAMRFYEKYVEVDGSIDSLLDLAKSYRKGKVFDKSEEIYHQVLEKEPDNREARIGLAQIKYARKENDFLEILDDLYNEDPDWLVKWLVEEFNFRIYIPEKIMLTPIQAAKFMGYDKVFELTQRAFKNEIPSHFNPARARLSFYREELENWAMVMNRFKCLPREVKLYPEILEEEISSAITFGKKEAQKEAAEESTAKQGRSLTKVEEILMQIRARKAQQLAAYRTGMESAAELNRSAQVVAENSQEESIPPKKKRGRPRKSKVEESTTVAPEVVSEQAEDTPPKKKRGRPRKVVSPEMERPSEAKSGNRDESGEEKPKKRRGRPPKNRGEKQSGIEQTDVAAEVPKKRGRPKKKSSGDSNSGEVDPDVPEIEEAVQDENSL